jgi:hypothetical protein
VEVPEVVIRVGAGVIRVPGVQGVGGLQSRIRTRTIQEGGQGQGQDLLYDDDATPPMIAAQHLGRETMPRRRESPPQGDETHSTDHHQDNLDLREDDRTPLLLVVDIPLLNVIGLHHVVIVLQQGMSLHASLANRVIVDQRLEMIDPCLVVRLHQSDVGHPVLGDAILDLLLEGGKVIRIQKIAGGDLKALTVEIRRKGDGPCGLNFSK